MRRKLLLKTLLLEGIWGVLPTPFKSDENWGAVTILQILCIKRFRREIHWQQNFLLGINFYLWNCNNLKHKNFLLGKIYFTSDSNLTIQILFLKNLHQSIKEITQTFANSYSQASIISASHQTLERGPTVLRNNNGMQKLELMFPMLHSYYIKLNVTKLEDYVDKQTCDRQTCQRNIRFKSTRKYINISQLIVEVHMLCYTSSRSDLKICHSQVNPMLTDLTIYIYIWIFWKYIKLPKLKRSHCHS